MLPIYFTLVYVVLNSDALSIGVVRAQNVTKREANVEDLFPDWVPFKNKHGEQLGEFVQVAKPKPKKRLAPPVNFILRAVAEPEGEEYYDKGQGEGDGEEYFEKKEWSDTNRPAAEPEEKVKVQNHTDISDIDGVVNIITRRPNPVVEALKKAKQNAEQKKDEDRSEEEEQEAKPEPKKEEKEKAARPTVAPVTPAPEKSPKYEEEADYEEEGTVKHKPDPSDDEQSENEAKKASILDSVDELKERHAEEQRVINEKLKEDVITQEEQERDRLNGQPINEHLDKYADHKPIIQKPRVPDYEEYDYKDINKEDKYLATPERTKPTTTRLPQRTKKQKGKKQVETGKLSVFKNPQLYIVYDDELEETTTMKPRAKPKPKTSKLKKVKENKYSAKYVVKPTSAEATERISMVPEENDIKEGEPTLFFPKKRKNKKRKKTRPTAPIDSLVAETVSAQRAKEKAIEPSALDSIVTDTTEAVPSAADAVSANTDSVTDAVVASTEHKAAPKHDNYHREKGGGKEYSSSHEEEHGEEGKKAYEKQQYFEPIRETRRHEFKKGKPWASTKNPSQRRVITRRKITWGSMMTTEASISIMKRRPATTAHTTMKNTGKNMPSMKSRASIRKDIARKAAMTSIKKRNMRKKLNSLRKTGILARRRNMGDMTMSTATRRAVTSNKATLRRVTRSTTVGTQGISPKEDTCTCQGVISRPEVMTDTERMHKHTKQRVVTLAARNGSTTTAHRPKQQRWYE
ncbi:uncharacterized protein LOC142980708 isoform X1 [Anticarsia gemmatalis]|uniref:uncharacterized protein LOC142980708 isoform X1 n=1 Tax=Anticarsia gemmatalis TaxID=129554 RepID=UPI003F7777CA